MHRRVLVMSDVCSVPGCERAPQWRGSAYCPAHGTIVQHFMFWLYGARTGRARFDDDRLALDQPRPKEDHAHTDL